MNTRRDFIKQAALVAGSSGVWNALPDSLKKAIAINPELGSTFYDAEHVVILMQENRSFDHCFGSLQGVRGFNDPRAVKQPNGNKVWLQSDKKGQTYAPFRLNIKDTRATWMGSLPHSWSDMVDAHNKGKMDSWLEAKRAGNKEYVHMPLTMGYYNREDIPFYYAMADTFTVGDQHFCSSLTGTTPNRLYLWSGTVRDPKMPNAIANVRNSDVNYRKNVDWRTFPELLEMNDISWRIYQNELSLDTGFTDEEEPWLANFTNNPIEWFEQFHVWYSETYLEELKRKVSSLEKEIAAITNDTPEKEEMKNRLKTYRESLEKWTPENFSKLPEIEKNIHAKAFTTNKNHSLYRQVVDSTYDDNGVSRTMKVPAGDVLYQFRHDVDNGTLPTVSWLVPPQHFSDHPGSPWYGAWCVSEVMNILTKNPDFWKKTIFIVTYDENDGYFDHIPPFVPPSPNGEGLSGKVSEGISMDAEFVNLNEELNVKKVSKDDARANSIGLGFRVPLLIASPWSRGGKVNSEVLDHTSIIQFLENFLSKKTGKEIKETNISEWRRTVCGDLTSAFSTYNGEEIQYPQPVDKEKFIQSIYNAKFKELPSGYKLLNAAEINTINQNKAVPEELMPSQESGIRDSCALPYQMHASGSLSNDKKSFAINFKAGNPFGKRSAGVPFLAYATTNYQEAGSSDSLERGKSWAYAVKAGDALTENWALNNFENSSYALSVYGPNGFFRSFAGNSNDPALLISDGYRTALSISKAVEDKLVLRIANNEADKKLKVTIRDKSYGSPVIIKEIMNGQTVEVDIDTAKNHGWYDFKLQVDGYESFSQQFAGRVETGEIRKTDPLMGKMLKA